MASKMKPVGENFESEPIEAEETKRKTWGSGVFFSGSAELRRVQEQAAALGFRSVHAYLLWAVRYVAAGVASGAIVPERQRVEDCEIVQPDYPKEGES